jgi:hypothetical protein
MTTELVAVSSLVEDFGFYPRHSVDATHVANIARALRSGASLPPVVVDRTTRRIVDGFHRCRAAAVVGGDAAMIAVEWISPGSDAALFEEAVRRNATHGRRLDRQDEIRVTVLAEHFGLAETRVAAALQVEPERVMELRARVVIVEGEPIPAKPLARHLYGTAISESQAAALRGFSGTSPMLHIRQLTRALEQDLLDLSDEHLVAALRALAQLIDARLPVAA